MGSLSHMQTAEGGQHRLSQLELEDRSGSEGRGRKEEGRGRKEEGRGRKEESRGKGERWWNSSWKQQVIKDFC